MNRLAVGGFVAMVAFVAFTDTSRGDETQSGTAAAPARRTLPNGIKLPDTWPPRAQDYLDEPSRAPYLVSPPKVIPIDVGRQLFIDDFLIEQTTLERTFHRPAYYSGNPVLKPDQPWESGGRPYAMPFSDGVWYDPQDKTFKMWYYAGGGGATCYATSKDGQHWEKPQLDVEPSTNIVLKLKRDSNTVWLDPSPRDPSERFKMAVYHQGQFTLHRSADGIHWSKVSDGAKTGDRSTFFYNPFRQRWVFSIRSGSRLGRSRLYWETSDFWRFGEAASVKEDAVIWTAADRHDPPRDDLGVRPQLYNLDCVAYESVLLGLFSIWRGDYRNPTTEKAKELLKLGRPKANSVCTGFSRDGFHWDRPDRQPFLPLSEKMGDWNWGNLQSTAPCCLVMGEELWFYVSGRAGKSFPGAEQVDAGASTGLAMLRRDGFASMDAGTERGELTTRPIRFQGKHLFVNVDAPEGLLQVEILDEQGQVIAPLDRGHCQLVRGSSTRQRVTWEGAGDLAAVAGKPVRLRFLLTHGRLYSFWVTSDPEGASFGYVAGGGPGFEGTMDLPRRRVKQEDEERRSAREDVDGIPGRTLDVDYSKNRQQDGERVLPGTPD